MDLTLSQLHDTYIITELLNLHFLFQTIKVRMLKY